MDKLAQKMLGRELNAIESILRSFDTDGESRKKQVEAIRRLHQVVVDLED